MATLWLEFEDHPGMWAEGQTDRWGVGWLATGPCFLFSRRTASL